MPERRSLRDVTAGRSGVAMRARKRRIVAGKRRSTLDSVEG
jgi:hypothetical protein